MCVVAGVNTPDEADAYSFIPAPRNSLFRFQVKAGNDAQVILSEVNNPERDEYKDHRFIEVRLYVIAQRKILCYRGFSRDH